MFVRHLQALLIVAFVVPGAAAQPLPAEIAVTDAVLKKNLNPYDYCCVNWEWTRRLGSLREIFGDPNRRSEFIRFLRDDVSIKCFRYPGGVYVRRFFFGVPAPVWTAAEDGKASNQWIEVEEFFKFLADGDFRTFLQVNTFTWFDPKAGRVRLIREKGKPERVDPEALEGAADAVERLAQWVKKNNYQRLIRFWEIGNEEYRSEVYPDIAEKIIRRILKVLPDARIVPVTQVGLWKGSGLNRWTRHVLEELDRRGLKAHIHGATSHIYAFAIRPKHRGATNSTAYQEHAANCSFIATDPGTQPWGSFVAVDGKRVSVAQFNAHNLDLAGYGGRPIYITEFKNGGMYERYNKALAGGIGNTLLLASFVAAPRIGGACHHSLLHGSHITRPTGKSRGRAVNIWGYNVIHYQADENLQPRFVSTPNAEGFNLIWKLARGDVLETRTSTKLLYSVATREGDTLRLLVVNRAARPDKPTDVSPNKWGWARAAEQLAKACERGDRFRAAIVLPASFQPSPHVHLYSLGESEHLSDYSADPGTYDIHEIKVKATVAVISSDKLEYRFAPHSVVLFEFTAKGRPPSKEQAR